VQGPCNNMIGRGLVERGGLENHSRSFILILSNTSLALWVREICYVSCTVVRSVLTRSGTFGSIRWQTRWQNPKGAKPLRNFAKARERPSRGLFGDRHQTVSLAARHLKRQEFRLYLPHNPLKLRSDLVSLVRSSMV
jgi:hypothetical protein